jgi:hypothetical protein
MTPTSTISRGTASSGIARKLGTGGQATPVINTRNWQTLCGQTRKYIYRTMPKRIGILSQARRQSVTMRNKSDFSSRMSKKLGPKLIFQIAK